MDFSHVFEFRVSDRPDTTYVYYDSTYHSQDPLPSIGGPHQLSLVQSGILAVFFIIADISQNFEVMNFWPYLN